MDENRVIIAGSRSITDYSVVETAIAASGFDIDEVVSGRADGVDTLGERWASEHDVPISMFPYSDFEDGSNGKPAPLVRNDAMAEYATALVAVWDGSSSGTEYMIDAARREGLDVYVYRTDTFRLDQF